MSSSAGIALRAYLLPLRSTRALRIGFVLLGFLLLSIALAFGLRFAAHMFSFLPEDAAPTALRNIRRFVVAPGLAIAGILFSELSLRDGLRQRTLLYPMLGPVSRPMLAVVRTLATATMLALGCSALVILTRLLEGNGFAPLGGELAAVILGSFAYIAVFGFLHLIMTRGLFAGLGLLVLDMPLAHLPFGIRRYSLTYHVRALADTQVDMELPVNLAGPETSLVLSVAVLVLVAVVMTALTAVVFRRKSLGGLC